MDVNTATIHFRMQDNLQGCGRYQKLIRIDLCFFCHTNAGLCPQPKAEVAQESLKKYKPRHLPRPVPVLSSTEPRGQNFFRFSMRKSFCPRHTKNNPSTNKLPSYIN